MGIFGMLSTGASGMNAQSSKLSAISDNIANSETAGYKSAGVQFASLLLPSGESQYNSGSVITKVTHAISTPGTLLGTTSVTDLAVQGDGFYLVNATPSTPSTSPTMMTRAGSFVQDGDGYLINTAGFGLMGYNSDGAGNPVDANGNPINLVTGSTTDLTPIQISSVGLKASPTTGGTLTMNLNSQCATGDTYSVVTTAFDDLGKSFNITFTMTKDAAANTWSIASVPASAAALANLVFDTDGTLLTPTPTTNPTPPPATYTYSLDLTAFGCTNPINIDMSASTQLATGTPPPNGSTLQNTLNGGAPSQFDHLTISDIGVVSIVYGNGVTIPKFVIPLAKVAGTDNLEALSGNVFIPTTESGPMQIGLTKTSGLGLIKSTSLEQSNVDIGTELAALIETQRIYEANSKVFETGSTLTDTLINLVR